MVQTGLAMVLTIYIFIVQIGPDYGVDCLFMVSIVYLWCRLDLLMVLLVYLWCLMAAYDAYHVFIIIKVFTRDALYMLKFVDVTHSMFTTRSSYAYIVWYMLFVFIKCL
jgi:hypothetical protein